MRVGAWAVRVLGGALVVAVGVHLVGAAVVVRKRPNALFEHLTAQRSNGLRSLVDRIKRDAEALSTAA